MPDAMNPLGEPLYGVIANLRATSDGAREARSASRAPPETNFAVVATPASSTGYDSTSPYMEQNETKRGAHWLFLTSENAPFCDKAKQNKLLHKYQFIAGHHMRAPLDCQVILLLLAAKITPRIHLRRLSVLNAHFRNDTRAPPVLSHVEGAAPRLLERHAAP